MKESTRALMQKREVTLISSRIAVGAALVIGLVTQPLLAPPMTPIFDWNHRGYDAGVSQAIIPVPFVNIDLQQPSAYDAILNASTPFPLALMMVECNAPACAAPPCTGTCYGSTLADVMDYLENDADPPTALAYVFGDLEEADTHDDHIDGIVALITLDDFHDGARMGNYQDYPGEHDYTAAYPPCCEDLNPVDCAGITECWEIDDPTRADADDFYNTSGLNVAMPAAYPYEVYYTHTYQDTVAPYSAWPYAPAPNNRAALFWAPLERVSVAAGNLPSGHQLIPWVAGFGAECYEDSPSGCETWYTYSTPPARADMMAMLMHLRLRGAHGYYTLGSGLDAIQGAPEPYTYSLVDYREDMLDTWQSLDTHLPAAFTPTVLNLNTDKDFGVQWSGVTVNGKAVILVSNLKGAGAVELPEDIADLPSSFPSVSCKVYPGTHVLVTYQLTGSPSFTAERIRYTSCQYDVNGDEHVGIDDYYDVIGAWGTSDCGGTPTCPCNPADVDASGSVNIDDLNGVLNGGMYNQHCF